MLGMHVHKFQNLHIRVELTCLDSGFRSLVALSSRNLPTIEYTGLVYIVGTIKIKAYVIDTSDARLLPSWNILTKF